MKIEHIVLNAARSVTLTAYLLDVGGEFGNIPKRPAVLVLPGGGYAMCSDREADPVALAYLEAGFQAFVLRYSVGEGVVWPIPLEDYEQAMELLRARAEEWNLYPDKIAVVGFSAGGHLAAGAAAVAKNKPNAAILGYAVTEGAIVKVCLPTAPDLVDKVDGDTCPCFVFATRTDNVVPVSNSLHFVQALEEHGIMFESHIYAYGPHGFSVGSPAVLAPDAKITPRAARWVGDSIAWLKELFGDFGGGALTAPRFGRRTDGDNEPFLSVDCTMDRLMASPRARELLAPIMAAAQAKMAEKYGDMMDALGHSPQDGMGMKMTLRAALAYGSTPQEAVERLDAALRQIPNP